MDDKKLFFSKHDDDEMIQAFKKAQDTFKYFWRELSWEARRIIPALGAAFVKIAFRQDVEGDDLPIIEHMWVNQIYFDGDLIHGVLMNSPSRLTNVTEGDSVQVSLNQLSDWLFTCMSKTYGGFSIQLLRSRMNDAERENHDEAWGLDFGDPNDILIAYEQKEHPENLIEHPMCVSMGVSLGDFLKENPEEVTGTDEEGYTFLIRETIAGNMASVKAILEAGADVSVKTASGKTAGDYAKQLNWEHLLPLFEG